MKRYKLTLIPEGKTFDSLFDSKQDATTFVYQYIANHPRNGLTPFDFRLDECDELPTDITSYDKAISSLGGLEFVTISVDVENREKLSILDTLMTISRAWNKVDGFDEGLPTWGKDRFYPKFSYFKDEEEEEFSVEHNVTPENIFGIEALISFRSSILAEEFSTKYKENFAKLFNIPFEP